MSLDTSKLQCVKRNGDGTVQAACPACRAAGADKTGNHLKVWTNGAFNCIIDNSRPHNLFIRSHLRGLAGETDDVIYIEPKLEVEQVYPENTLTKLLPDYAYWRGRGMKEDVLQRLENGVAPLEEKSKLSGRSVFPCRNLDGKLVGFSGRLLTESSYAPKWKHLVRSSQLVYPWNVTGEDIIATKTVVLTESIGDLAACLSHDIKPVLCILGLNLNSLIISTLLAHDVRRIIISLNRDNNIKKGEGAALRISSKLDNFFTDVRIAFPPEGTKDWGDAAERGDDAAFEVLRKEIA